MSGFFNKVILLGNVTRDVVVRTLPSNQKVAEIGLAINRSYMKDGDKKEETTFVDVTFWGKQAETLGQYLQKGRSLLVEGRLKYDTWEQDGQKRSKLKVIGDTFQFVGTRGEGMPGDAPRSAPSKKSSGAPAPANSYSDSYDDDFGSNISDEDIPF